MTRLDQAKHLLMGDDRMQVRKFAAILPILDWAPAYRRDWLRPDVFAGLAVWAVMVPEGMAYVGIVGVPPIIGLYKLVPPLFLYAIFGSSRRLVVGPDTATGVISALTIGALVARGSAEFAVLTSSLAVLIGLLFLLFGILRTGWVAAFVATPVMRGFIEGLVCVTIIGQLASLLGLAGAHGNFILRKGDRRCAAVFQVCGSRADLIRRRRAKASLRPLHYQVVDWGELPIYRGAGI